MKVINKRPMDGEQVAHLQLQSLLRQMESMRLTKPLGLERLQEQPALVVILESVVAVLLVAVLQAFASQQQTLGQQQTKQ
jgi:hypothetical protein